MRPYSILSSVAITAALLGALPAQSPFTIGNLVVVRVGDGTSALTSAAAPVYLDEFTTTGTLVQSLPMPTSTSGANRTLTIRGTSSSEGYLNVSTNGLYLLMAGYDAALGTASSAIESSTAATLQRVLGRIDLSGSIDTTTALTDAYDGSPSFQGNIRAVASDDGFRLWTSGTGVSPSGGVRFVANLGDATSVALQSGAPQNTRVVGIYDDQLYVTSASTVYLGVNQIGQGLSGNPGQAAALLPGFPTTGGTAASSAYDFFFADANTLYVADDNATASTVGGINKWTFDPLTNTWVRQYRLQLNGPGSNTACRGLTGFVRNGVVTLWGTANTSGQTATTLITVTDTGPGSTVVALAPSPLNTAFRGVRYLAKPTTVARIPTACGTTGIKVNGNAEVGTDVRTTILNPVGFPFVGYGTTLIGAPILPGCSCTIGHDFAVLQSVPLPPLAASSTLSIPNQISLIGTTIYVQGLDALAPGGCTVPLDFTLTDYFSVQVQ
jgi:hypothetical protein